MGIPGRQRSQHGSYMWKQARDNWGFKGWSAADAGLESLAAFLYHDMIFAGPMAGASRIFPAIAMADAFLASAVFAETRKLPKDPNHPLPKIVPGFCGATQNPVKRTHHKKRPNTKGTIHARIDTKGKGSTAFF